MFFLIIKRVFQNVEGVKRHCDTEFDTDNEASCREMYNYP